ncbi:MAG: hypothetical protein OQJ87_00705 [Rhodospirillales bacterium]|nr:hypothetical protein [Rhodospirillales bacterium]MCW8952295.1 hypothetical protein [Rhodospirillales bacterium]MCW8969718.1 hypothetical protein [Rhodospirillales bacterium]MCW9001214.1 hypothetical protein [Rhodospirillales bacterium]MCW9040445.1 hypothetical protein [Rhodospirillales bacterium]
MWLSRSVIVGLTAVFLFSAGPSIAQDDAAPPQPKAAAKKPLAKPKATSQKTGSGCTWLGKRVIQALLRDDIVAAGDFHNMFKAFSCATVPLEKAFDCVAESGVPETAVAMRERIDACWDDPASAAARNAAATVKNLAAPVKKPEATKP